MSSCLNLRHICRKCCRTHLHLKCGTLLRTKLWIKSACEDKSQVVPACNNINRVGLKISIVLYFVAKNLAMSLRTTFCKIPSMWYLGGIRFSATMIFRMFGRPPPLGVGYLYKHHEHNHFHHHLCLDHNNGNYDHDDHSDLLKYYLVDGRLV